MTESNPNPVVVAVGHDPIDAALAFAVDQAARAGCGLHLVHIVHVVAQGPETGLMIKTDVEGAGRRALEAARVRVHDLAGDLPVTAALRMGGVVPTIVEMTKDARLIVLQRRDLSSVMRIVTRSISSGVAARARVPVASVPSRWSSTQGDVASVTVGVDVAERSEEVLRAALGEARSRGAVLRVVHTWHLPSAYDDIIISRTEGEEWASRGTADIQATIDALGDDAVGVPLQIEVRHAHAADALVDASKETDLLVIGRHDPLLPIGSHLGPIARAVLREADCPVLLVDPRPTRGWRRRPQAAEKAAAPPI